MNRFSNIYCRVISLLSQLGRLIPYLLFKFSALFFKLHHSLVCLYVVPFFTFVFLVKLHYFLSSDPQFVHQNLYPLLKLVLSDHLLQSFPLVILDSLQAAHLFLESNNEQIRFFKLIFEFNYPLETLFVIQTSA